MAEITIPAEPRTEFGKGAARRIRRADQVPAVLYGHGTDPVHVTLPGHALMLALKNSNALLSIEVGSESHLAIPKQVQRDPLKGFIEHADLLIVKRGEKVVVDVAIQLEGDAQPETLVVLENATVSLEVEATHIPEAVEVSIEGLEVGGPRPASSVTSPRTPRARAPRASPRLTPRATPSRDLAGRGAREPGPHVRRHPAQRRVHGRRRARGPHGRAL